MAPLIKWQLHLCFLSFQPSPLPFQARRNIDSQALILVRHRVMCGHLFAHFAIYCCSLHPPLPPLLRRKRLVPHNQRERTSLCQQPFGDGNPQMVFLFAMGIVRNHRPYTQTPMFFSAMKLGRDRLSLRKSSFETWRKSMCYYSSTPRPTIQSWGVNFPLNCIVNI